MLKTQKPCKGIPCEVATKKGHTMKGKTYDTAGVPAHRGFITENQAADQQGQFFCGKMKMSKK